MLRPLRRLGLRGPLLGIGLVLVAVLLMPGAASAAEWSDPERLTGIRGSRLDSLHQMASGGGTLHIAHPRIGPNRTDDRVVYQRSTDNGASWTKERTLFTSSTTRRHVVPNLAVAARGQTLVVAWRATGPDEANLYARVSIDGGKTFGPRRSLSTAKHRDGIGVPAAAVGDDLIAVAWTSRSDGRIKIRTSRTEGRTFKAPKTLGRTRLSIDCKRQVTDGLVGLAAVERKIHLAWSHAGSRSCQASSIKVRTTLNRGDKWKPERTLTRRRSYGWPELDVRGRTVVATVQSPTGGFIVARSRQNGRSWTSRLFRPRKGHSYSAADIVLLPKGKAMVTYVNERVANAKLINTRLVSRRSSNSGGTFASAKNVTGTSTRLRMAPNIDANGSKIVIGFQSGPLSGSPTNIMITRLR